MDYDRKDISFFDIKCNIELFRNIGYTTGLLERSIVFSDVKSTHGYSNFTILNSNKWNCCVCAHQPLTKVPPVLSICILLDGETFFSNFVMASRRERIHRTNSNSDDRERGTNSSSRNSHLYQNSLPIAKKVRNLIV